MPLHEESFESRIMKNQSMEITRLKHEVDELKTENYRLSELLWGSRCVFCGEVLGKDRKNQDIADEVLREHVMSCLKHPLWQARARIMELEHNLAVNGIDFTRGVGCGDGTATISGYEWRDGKEAAEPTKAQEAV